MTEVIVVLLVLLWVLGYIDIPGLNIPNPILFTVNGHPVSFVDVLIFALILWALEILPTPFREIAFVLLILWILATLGIIALANFSSIIVIALIVALLFSHNK
jgi:hypothetical protein